MNKIHIKQFGPVQEADIDIDKKMQVFIGAQASGKSTVCKVTYFCQKIRDYTLEFLMDGDKYFSNHRNEYFNLYLKYLTKQFMKCFGKTTYMQKFRINYAFGDKQIDITLNHDGYVRFKFDSGLKEDLNSLINEAAKVFLNKLNSDKVNAIIDNITVLALLRQQFKERLCGVFENDAEIMYIPAGRSLLATMSEQLHDFSVADMDLTMQDFINLVRNTKNKFDSKIPDIVKSYTKTVRGQINNSALKMAYDLIKRIFKADYISENDGEKIYFGERCWIKLMHSSSGQQEVLWILMLAFNIILENKKSFVIVEEPEAHLFPIAQKDVISLISLMLNLTDSKAIITTHSPYILTSLNILLYSDKVERNLKVKRSAVINKSVRINYNMFGAYKFESGINESSNMENLLDEGSHMIGTDYIDYVSSITNIELSKLLDESSVR